MLSVKIKDEYIEILNVSSTEIFIFIHFTQSLFKVISKNKFNAKRKFYLKVSMVF